MERKKDSGTEEREQLRKQVVDDSRNLLKHFWPFHPVQLFIDLLWTVMRLFQPLAIQLVPLAVFSIVLPLIVFLSVGSGYLVWKNVAISWETELSLQYGDGVSPYAEVPLWNIVPDQPYDIFLTLVVPANEANFALGNFMASLTLLSQSNSTIAVSRKPAIVLPQYLAPLAFFYNRPGTVDLNIHMFNEIVLGTSRALARVQLGRQDQWKTLGEGHGRELAVLSGSLRGVVIHHGIRGLISQFPLMSAVAASSVFFFILFVVLVACLMPAVEWHFPPDDEIRPMEPEEKSRKRRRSRRMERDEDRSSKSRPKTPTGRRGDASSSRSRHSKDYREADVKTEAEGEDDWDQTVYHTPTAPEKTSTTSTAYRDSSPPVRRRLSRPPGNDDYE